MWKVARRAIASNKIRFTLTTFTVFLGVAFVVASFVVADSLRDTFGELASDVNEGKDLIVRGAVAAGDRNLGAPPVDEALVAQIGEIPGVDLVEGELFVLGTVSIDDNGDPIQTFGPPVAGVNWGDEVELNQWVLTDGERPDAPDEFALDADSFDEYEYTIGNTYTVVTPAYGPREFRLSGVVQFGDDPTDSAGARFVAFDTPTAQDVLGYPTAFNEIWINLYSGRGPIRGILRTCSNGREHDIAFELPAGLGDRSSEGSRRATSPQWVRIGLSLYAGEVAP